MLLVLLVHVYSLLLMHPYVQLTHPWDLPAVPPTPPTLFTSRGRGNALLLLLLLLH
jgi:hypothetical protein